MKIFNYVKDKGIKRMIQVLYEYKIQIVFIKLCSIFTKNKALKNVIIIESHNDFDCNGGAFYDYLIKNNYNKKYKIVWLLKHMINLKLPENVITYPLYKPSICKAYYICVAKYFTADCVITEKVRSEQKSFYFDHGAIALKNVAGKCFIPDSVDFILTPSEFYTPVLANQLELNCDSRRFVCLGYPSQDILFTPTTHEILKITEKKMLKTVLWMPTFRKGGGYCRNDSTKDLPMGIPIIKDEQSFRNLNSILKQMNMLLIIKIHPMQDLDTIKIHSLSNIFILTGIKAKELKIDNCRLMKDMDGLISDYSSAAYDFLMLERPIGYDFSDLNDYKNGLCVESVDDFIAGPKIYDYNQLVEFLKMVSENEDPYVDARKKLKHKLYKYTDSNNCERIVKFMGL